MVAFTRAWLEQYALDKLGSVHRVQRYLERARGILGSPGHLDVLDSGLPDAETGAVCARARGSQGSDAAYYSVQVVGPAGSCSSGSTAPATACSCPSHANDGVCKHALALILWLLHRQPVVISAAEASPPPSQSGAHTSAHWQQQQPARPEPPELAKPPQPHPSPEAAVHRHAGVGGRRRLPPSLMRRSAAAAAAAPAAAPAAAAALATSACDEASGQVQRQHLCAMACIPEKTNAMGQHNPPMQRIQRPRPAHAAPAAATTASGGRARVSPRKHAWVWSAPAVLAASDQLLLQQCHHVLRMIGRDTSPHPAGHSNNTAPGPTGLHVQEGGHPLCQMQMLQPPPGQQQPRPAGVPGEEPPAGSSMASRGVDPDESKTSATAAQDGAWCTTSAADPRAQQPPAATASGMLPPSPGGIGGDTDAAARVRAASMWARLLGE